MHVGCMQTLGFYTCNLSVYEFRRCNDPGTITYEYWEDYDPEARSELRARLRLFLQTETYTALSQSITNVQTYRTTLA